MFRFTIENVRSLYKRQEVEVRPLTILVGENSTGKSTFLALMAAMCNSAGFPFDPRFNEPPHNLGTFDTIASFRGGRGGRAKNFVIGYTNSSPRPTQPSAVLATYRDHEGQPDLSHLLVESKAITYEVAVDETRPRGAFTGDINVRTPEGSFSWPFSAPSGSSQRRSLTLFELIWSETERDRKMSERLLATLRSARNLPTHLAPLQAISLAPIRTRPERTYSAPVSLFDPTGEHVPFVLARIDQEPSDSEKPNQVSNALLRYGIASGLFESLDVRRLGRKAGDPFQLLVKIANQPRNLIDVGYGVSQGLPVVVECALLPPHSGLLLQQPEVHLHPKAQAALGEFLGEMVSRPNRYYVVETHSDFIIDRVRQMVARGVLQPADISLLFFERTKLDTKVHQLELDMFGNIVSAPSSYRAFFMQEELNLLTRSRKR